MAALRVLGDNLDPDEITRLLGREPTGAHRKGDQNRTSTGHVVVRKSGVWFLDAQTRIPGDLDSQASEILSLLTSNIAVWRDLSSRFYLELYCGLFMRGTNDACELSPTSLLALGERGITFSFEVYAPVQSPRPDELCACGSGTIYFHCCARKAV